MKKFRVMSIDLTSRGDSLTFRLLDQINDPVVDQYELDNDQGRIDEQVLHGDILFGRYSFFNIEVEDQEGFLEDKDDDRSQSDTYYVVELQEVEAEEDVEEDAYGRGEQDDTRILPADEDGLREDQPGDDQQQVDHEDVGTADEGGGEDMYIEPAAEKHDDDREGEESVHEAHRLMPQFAEVLPEPLFLPELREHGMAQSGRHHECQGQLFGTIAEDGKGVGVKLAGDDHPVEVLRRAAQQCAHDQRHPQTKMLPHERRRDTKLGIPHQQDSQPDKTHHRRRQHAVDSPDNGLAEDHRQRDNGQLDEIGDQPVTDDQRRLVLQQVNILHQDGGIADQHIQQQKVEERHIAVDVEYREVVLDDQTEDKSYKAEKGEQQEGIEDLGRLLPVVFPRHLVGVVAVVERQKRLYQPAHPEKADDAGNEHEHLEKTYVVLAQPYLGEDNADKQKSAEPHDLVQLQAGDIIEELREFQSPTFLQKCIFITHNSPEFRIISHHSFNGKQPRKYSATPGDNPLICNTNKILFPLIFVALPMTLKNNAGFFQRIVFETPTF